MKTKPALPSLIERFFTERLMRQRNVSPHTIAQIDILRDAVRRARIRAPFHIDAWVVRLDHMHCLWTLPPGDANFPERWRAIKIAFVKSLPAGEVTITGDDQSR